MSLMLRVVTFLEVVQAVGVVAGVMLKALASS